MAHSVRFRLVRATSIALLGVSYIYFGTVYAQTQESALANHPESGKGFDMGDRSFVPVSKEWAYADSSDTSPDAYIRVPSTNEFAWPNVIRSASEFHGIEQKLAEFVPERYRLVDCGKLVVIEATRGPVTDGMHYINTLDRRISLHLSGASVWKALAAFNLELNQQGEDGIPNKLGFVFSGLGPKAFTSDGAVSIDMTDTPAKEVLRAILRQSPVSLSYKFLPAWGLVDGRRKPVTTLTISFFDRNGRFVHFEVKGELYGEEWEAELHGDPQPSLEEQLKKDIELVEANQHFYEYINQLELQQKNSEKQRELLELLRKKAEMERKRSPRR